VRKAAAMVEMQGRQPIHKRVHPPQSKQHFFDLISERTWSILWFVIIVGGGLALRWPFFSVPMNADEGGYAYVAQRWLDGRGQLYDNLWVSRPQGIFLAYGLIFRTLGTSTEAIHVAAWLVGLATTLFVWLFAREWLGRRAGIAAALIFTLVTGSPYLDGFTANAEVFLALPAAAVAWLLLRSVRKGWNPGILVTTGVLAAMSTLLKPTGIVMWPVGIAFIWLMSAQSRRTAVKRSAWLTGGFVLGLAPAFIHGWMIGWDNFIYASITYRLEFQSSATVTLAHHWERLTELVRHVRSLAAAVHLVAGVRMLSGLSWLPAPRLSPRVVGVVARPFPLLRVAPRAEPEPEATLLHMWLIGCLVGIAIGGDWWVHYLIQAAAPLSIWIVVSLRELGDRMDRFWRSAITSIVVALLVGQYWVGALGSPNEISYWLNARPDYLAATDVSAYLKSHAPPETPIYVAFSQPAVYFQSDLPAAYRYLYQQELGALPGVEHDLVTMIKSPNRPMYIVGTGQRAPFEDGGRAFWNALFAHYHLETTVHGKNIYRANKQVSVNRWPNSFVP
jgi:4-amino-4-deoxy-L-arabinose transferase-like glycosyltransferase